MPINIFKGVTKSRFILVNKPHGIKGVTKSRFILVNKPHGIKPIFAHFDPEVSSVLRTR